MKFKYIIVGRVPGDVSYSRYEGIVDVSTPKLALVAALADQFGDKDDGEPYEQLTQSGWCDEVTFDDQWSHLDDHAHNFCLDTGEHTYDVVVDEWAVDDLAPLVINLDDLERPKDLSRAALEDIVDEVQSFLFKETDEGRTTWTPDKELSGADFIEHMMNVLENHGLVPERDYPVVD